MATANPRTTRSERQLAILQQERKTEQDSKQAVWVFIWTLFFFKLGTIGAIWYAANGTHEAQAIIFATSWFWVAIPAAAIAGPVMFWRRLRKQRRRRDELRRSEWNVEKSGPLHGRVVLTTLDDDPRLA